uniref:NADH-ubiquinone oxidoreductase chain 6 n=1 Tax=Varicospira cancellata TaxID=2821816 RepID=A0A8A6KKC8_9CAEN|nr:NADH dehydrogenase subunit 6 [Varicospira cancellata]QTI82472.1 NADH dehydrogenase subunit 6 [Varicospira cancellata]
MSTTLLLSITMAMIMLLPLMKQPLSLGLVIMISTLMMCMLSALFVSSWYAYILFLIYVGGLLVMFAYVAALSPNTLFKKNYPFIMFLLSIPMIMSIFYFHSFLDLNSTTYVSSFSENKYLKTYGTQLVSPNMISVLIGLALILLINLVVVVKICFYQYAPLRPFKTM